MIIGEITGVHGPAAVLTLIFVTQIYILSGKADRVISKADKMKKPYHSGQLDGESNRSDLPIVGFQHLDLAQGQEGNSPLP